MADSKKPTGNFAGGVVGGIVGGAAADPAAGTAAGNAASNAAHAVAAALTGSGSSSTCALSIPVVGCVLTKTQCRAIIGGLLIAAGGLIAVVGLGLLVKGVTGVSVPGLGRA
jgi:hypothetical protein